MCGYSEVTVEGGLSWEDADWCVVAPLCFYRGGVEVGAMVSLPDELQARESAARQRVEELQAEAVELAVRLEEDREDLSRLEITWETFAMVLAELSAAEADPDVPAECRNPIQLELHPQPTSLVRQRRRPSHRRLRCHQRDHLGCFCLVAVSL